MTSVPKRGSVGLLYEMSPIIQADPTLPRFGTDFIFTSKGFLLEVLYLVVVLKLTSIG